MIDQEQLDREARREQANREELVERIARAVPEDRTVQPLKGLYLCGAGTHPGGGITGRSGANAAREIIQDLRKRRS